MKKILVIAAIIVGFFAANGQLMAQKSFKVGFVNVELIVTEMPEAQQADKILKDLGKKYQDSLLAMQSEFEQSLSSYEKQKSMMPPDQQAQEEEALQTLQMQILQFRETKFGQQGEIAQLREQYLEPIREKVRKAIEKVASEEAMNVVLDKGSSAVLYNEEKLDITYRVLDRIKRGNE
ncbi:MAG: OmpH family outer membrane protein [Candidatus Kapaibacterium sp.]